MNVSSSNISRGSNSGKLPSKPAKKKSKAEKVAKLIYPKEYSAELNLEESKHKTTKFRTHKTRGFRIYHKAVKFLLTPSRLALENLSRVVEPMPGAHKNSKWRGPVIRVSSLVLAIVLTPPAFAFGLIGKGLEMISHTYRPLISYIDNSAEMGCDKKENPLLSEDNPLHIRTHNLGFVINSMSNVGDLRKPKTRAKEVVSSIKSDPNPPDMIFFQEAFNEGATRTLCDGIKKQYPYIIYNIAPQIGGFPSGQLIASKYPIDKIEYERLEGMLSVEKMAPRGIVTATIRTEQGPLKVYSVHTAPLLGHERAQARVRQMNQIQTKMEKDLEEDPHLKQVLVGDFNTSRLTAWGEDNAVPPNQAETPVLEKVNEYFDDLYLEDHDEHTGERTSGAPVFLEEDNQRMGEELAEPSGSWYIGPFNDKGFVMKAKLKAERKKRKFDKPDQVINNPDKAAWGTSKWHEEQLANTARFDLILVPKESPLTGRVEARRMVVPKGTQSAPTDHLPVDARIWIKENAHSSS